MAKTRPIACTGQTNKLSTLTFLILCCSFCFCFFFSLTLRVPNPRLSLVNGAAVQNGSATSNLNERYSGRNCSLLHLSIAYDMLEVNTKFNKFLQMDVFFNFIILLPLL